MKHVYALIFSAFTFSASAQNSIEPGSTWTVQELQTMGGFTQIDTTIECAEYSITDSVFKYNRWYYPLYSSGYHNGQVFTNDTVALLRSQGQKIWARSSSSNRFSGPNSFDTNEFVLYDYSLMIGDTIQLKFQGNKFYNNRETIETYRVINRDSLHTTSGKRLRLSLVFDRASPSSFIISNYSNLSVCGIDTVMEWIESIGTREGFYYPINGSDCQGFYPDYFIQSLVCFEIDSVPQFIPTPDCDCVQQQSLAELALAEVKVFPNPVNSEISLKLPVEWTNRNGTIEILNFQGQKLIEHPLDNNLITIAWDKNFVRGLYILNIRISGTITYNTKVLKD